MGLFQRASVATRGRPMTGYHFRERVRQVLAMAREEAVGLGAGHVGTEHLLLGLLREGEGVAVAALRNLGADAEALRGCLTRTLRPGAAGAPDLPYTTGAKRVLELAIAAARELDHPYVGTEHLLLGLIGERQGIAAQVLVDAGVTFEAARTETLRLLGDTAPETLNAPPSPFAAVEAEASSRRVSSDAVGRATAPAREAEA